MTSQSEPKVGYEVEDELIIYVDPATLRKAADKVEQGSSFTVLGEDYVIGVNSKVVFSPKEDDDDDD